MIFNQSGTLHGETHKMTFEKTGPRLVFVLEGVPFGGGGNPRGNVLVSTKVVNRHSSFPTRRTNTRSPGRLNAPPEARTQGCREQL